MLIVIKIFLKIATLSIVKLKYVDLSKRVLEGELMDSISTNEVIDYFKAMKCRKLVLH